MVTLKSFKPSFLSAINAFKLSELVQKSQALGCDSLRRGLGRICRPECMGGRNLAQYYDMGTLLAALVQWFAEGDNSKWSLRRLKKSPRVAGNLWQLRL